MVAVGAINMGSTEGIGAKELLLGEKWLKVPHRGGEAFATARTQGHA